jgi:ubiquitin C-terminal hydrolase
MENKGVCRFNNIDGVTCYMNSILAILQQTPIFTDYILSSQFKEKLFEKFKNNIQNSILFQLHNIINISHSNENAIINPFSFRKIISMKDEIWGMRQQQDSQEFLSFILNNIEEEISDKIIFVPGLYVNKENNNSVYTNLIQIMAINTWQKYIQNEFSIIKNLFGFMSHVLIECNHCSNKSHNFDVNQILQLSINDNLSTLEECMDEYIKLETMDDSNKITCEFCRKKNKSIKRTMIWTTPKILIIQLKRFKINDIGIISGKINNNITYPIYNLNISKYIDSLSPYNKSNYNLFAINCHHGNTINYGHYTTIIQNRYNTKWYEYNDAKNLNEIDNIEQLITNNAYLLFYYRDN